MGFHIYCIIKVKLFSNSVTLMVPNSPTNLKALHRSVSVNGSFPTIQVYGWDHSEWRKS